MPDEESKKSVQADKRIVDALWKIAEPDEKVRLKNIELIIKTLSLKGEASEDLDYSLKRLITGLASTRKAARHGFSVALCEVLRSFEGLDVNHIVSSIFKLIPLSNSVGERSAPVVGQILAFGSLIRSGRLTKHPRCIASVVESVLELADQKPYIEQATCLVLQDLFDQIPQDVFRKHLWPVVAERISHGWEKSTPRSLWMLSVCHRLYPDVVNQEFLVANWNTDELYKLDTYPWFGKILKKSTALHPLIHPLCAELIDHLVTLGHKDFKQFWCLLAEESLLQVKQFQEAYLLFELVQLAIPKMKNHKLITCLFSSKFQELFIKSLRTKHSPLHKAASQLCDFLADYAAKCTKPSIQFSILKVFFTAPSSLLFDQVMKKTTVQSIVTALKPEAVQLYAQMLIGVLSDQDVQQDQLLSDSLKCHSARQLARLLSHPFAEETLKSQILQLLFLYGFFRIKEATSEIAWCDSVTILSDTVQDACRASFLKGLEYVQMPPVKKGYKGRLDHQQQTLMPVLDYAHILLHSPDFVEPTKSIDDLLPSWKKMKSMVKKVVRYNEKDGKTDDTNIFLIFYLQLSFLLFFDLSSAQRILGELNECCKRSLKCRKRALKATTVEVDPDEPYWADVVMDLLMSMLSDQSHFLRSLVFSVFPALCPFMTANSVKQLVDAVNPGTDGDPLEHEDDDEVEFHSGSSSSSDEDEEMNGASEKVDDEFRNKVRAALGHAAEDSDDDERYLSDSEMSKLDSAIAEAFKQRANPNKKKDKLKEEVTQTHFRLRCLDLLGTYIRREPDVQLTVLVIEPLVLTAKSGLKNKKLEGLFTKSCNILRNITTVKKLKHKSDVQHEDLQSVLKFLLATVQKVSDLKLKNVIVRLCSFVVSCSELVAKTRNVSSEERREVGEWYFKLCKELISNYFDKNALELNPQLISSLFAACADHAQELLEALEATAFENSKRLFKRSQALGLIVSILKQVSSPNFTKSVNLGQFSQSLLVKATGALKETVDTKLKPTFASRLLELISILFRSTPSEMSSACVPELVKVLNRVSQAKLDKQGRKCLRKIQTSLGVQGKVKPAKRQKKEVNNKFSQKKMKVEANV